MTWLFGEKSARVIPHWAQLYIALVGLPGFVGMAAAMSFLGFDSALGGLCAAMFFSAAFLQTFYVARAAWRQEI